MRLLLATLGFTTACSQAIADQAAPPVYVARTAIAAAPVKVRAPYDVQIIRADGSQLATHALKDRFYVQGNDGERYTIRVTNPTPNRVEAVITVDGLDVIDGEAGDLKKRGYVVPPYGETRVEGFRTSTADVATFRFSSVDDSYAGVKGKARNVGVIAVAIFEEQAAQQIIEPTPVQPNYRPYDYRDDLDEESEGGVSVRGGGARPEKTAKQGYRPPPPPQVGRVAPREPAKPADSVAPTGGAPGAKAPQYRPPHGDDRDGGEADYEPMEQPQVTKRTERPGLGTQFGESRYSAASFTRFVRAGDRPIAIAELRYNDAAGLMALGIPLQPLPSAGEINTRETADPFPGDERFARPPGR